MKKFAFLFIVLFSFSATAQIIPDDDPCALVAAREGFAAAAKHLDAEDLEEARLQLQSVTFLYANKDVPSTDFYSVLIATGLEDEHPGQDLVLEFIVRTQMGRYLEDDIPLKCHLRGSEFAPEND